MITKISIKFRCEPGSSVSIVSGYGLDHRAIEVRFPARRKDFSSNVSRQTLGPTKPPVQWVPGVLSPGLKRGLGLTLTTHLHLVPRLKMSRSYTSSPPSAFVACSGTALALSFVLENVIQAAEVTLPSSWWPLDLPTPRNEFACSSCKYTSLVHRQVL
jgi:hypothetical protein